MWVEFIVSCCPCCKRFFSAFSGFPLSSKTNIPNSKCPECGAFAWVKDLKTNQQLANTVSMCSKIRMLVGSDENDNKVESRTLTNTGNNKGTVKADLHSTIFAYDFCMRLL